MEIGLLEHAAARVPLMIAFKAGHSLTVAYAVRYTVPVGYIYHEQVRRKAVMTADSLATSDQHRHRCHLLAILQPAW